MGRDSIPLSLADTAHAQPGHNHNGAALTNSSTKPWAQRIRDWFPDREFFMRSQGQVRFIKVSSRVQKIGAASLLALGVIWAGSMGVMAWVQYDSQAELATFEQEKARIATTSERLEAYGDDLENVVDDLKQRQEVLDEMSKMLPDDIRDAGVNVTDSSEETAETVEKVGAAFPEARELAKLEARQIAFVERMTRFADYRARKAATELRQLGLDPKAMTQQNAEAVGGPLRVLKTSANGDLDPRFERLGQSLARMAALERALDGIPKVVPALSEMSSNFGYRRDPFTGGGAMHNGIDFRGARGSAIFAAGDGVVSFVGWKGGYGKTVEITHGNGMVTRYAHMSRFDVTEGQRVEAGATIGGIGSTGRSTGPHLHFEVRIDDRAVNPRKFLETRPNVLKEARRTDAPGAGRAQGSK